ncbi:MAG TPA: Rdx family protein [Candidatus Binataceae bacterium]|nr:Rdx family protein [Candidatus Binataceae bacterium]
MAANLEKLYGRDITIRPGKSGQFDVIVDGKLVFSKAEQGRFPLDGEVEKALAAILRA